MAFKNFYYNVRFLVDTVQNRSIQFGLCLSVPFIEAIAPVKGISLLTFLLFALGAILSGDLSVRILITRFQRSAVVGGILIIHLVALLFNSEFRASNLFFACQFLSIWGLYLLSPGELDSNKTLKGLALVLVPIALGASVVGLLKAYTLERGIWLFPFYYLYGTKGLTQPWGSSIRSDYNLFSIGLLFATYLYVFCCHHKNIFLKSIFLTLTTMAIFYSGSRRGFLYLFSLPILISFSMIYLRKFNWKYFLKLITYSFLISITTYVSTAVILTGVKHKSYVIIPDLLKQGVIPFHHISTIVPFIFDIGTSKSVMPNESDESDESIEVPDHSPFAEGQVAISETPEALVGAEEPFRELRPYSLDERTERWKLAKELLADRYFVLPGGYSYQRVFSCKYFGCSDIDYPHNFLLSEWLIGGLIGLILVVVLFVGFISNLKAIADQRVYLIVLIATFLVMPSILISGDYLFKSGMTVAILVLAKAAAERSIKVN